MATANVAKKMQDEDEINYNPALMASLVVEIVKLPQTMDFLNVILKAKTKNDLDKAGGQVQNRNFLMAILGVFGNGQRAGTVKNITYGELDGCKKIGGCYVGWVGQHKTSESSGPAPICFPMPGLWKACKIYADLYGHG